MRHVMSSFLPTTGMQCTVTLTLSLCVGESVTKKFTFLCESNNRITERGENSNT